MLLRFTLLTGLLLTGLMQRQAQAAFPTLYLKPVVLKQIYAPTTITSAGDGSGRLFVCDQPGKIHIIQGGMLLPTPFLNIASASNTPPNNGPGPVLSVGTNYSERGLLGLTFHPNYNKKDINHQPLPGFGKFYLNYNKAYVAGVDPPPPVADHTPNCVTIIAEFQVSASNPNVADPASERRLLVFTQPQSNHNGGQVEFGPDGYLYFGCGDGGQQEDNNVGHTGGSGAKPTDALGNGQDKTRYLGKIHRIDPLDPDGAGPLTYSIPTDNPFFNDLTPGLKKEIYAYGLRNPWRFSFDKRPGGTNRLFCGDVGGNRVEEVDIIVAGGNYGWRYKEGLEFPLFSSNAAAASPPGTNMTLPQADLDALVDPIAVYAHTNIPVGDPPTLLPKLGLSITGGFIYRGAAIPALQGKYVFGDYGTTSGASNGRMMGLEETAPLSGVFTLTQALPLLGTNPIVGQRIYCLGEDESGEIYVGLKTTAGVLALDAGMPAGGVYKIVAAIPGASGTATLEPSKDNTMFAEVANNSNAQGQRIYAGNTASSNPRRGLLAFDLTGLPSGTTTVDSASLQLTVEFGFGDPTPMSLFRLNVDWGEGTSFANPTGGTGVAATPNDATWTHRFFSTQTWTTPGGDYVPAATATTDVGTSGARTWSGVQLTADVQNWVGTPATNFGWILLGDEANAQTAKRIYSGEASTASVRPKLTVNHTAYSAPPATPFESWLTTYFPSNVPGQFVDPEGDNDGDGVKNQIEYAYGFSPIVFNASSDFSTGQTPAAGGATDLTVTFRRDSAATDLTYQLQTSTDLTTWTTIAQSVGGAAATGLNGGSIISDNTLSGTVKLVTAKQTLVAGANDRKFVRLRVDRQ
ncbi:PQQ-dependent sugar dehydrogenase [Prosthecobacter sp.]|uniref:PQQ-dependent sugar dehydrogenase n=1 Tax=Prosthecobacter sp. TaxID=1965333 RepID=UPI002AB9B7DA|nr:PQQ-dependent sugar dehydrogenase [Prosthecobacter sp.]MDZ4404474.1 PQQ-dependent sugar dehydrogenase [Prosthecobacter sp.]